MISYTFQLELILIFGKEEIRTENRHVLNMHHFEWVHVEDVVPIRTNFISLDLIDLVQVGDIADATVSDKDVIVDQTGNGQPRVDVFDQMGQSSGMRFVFVQNLSRKAISKRQSASTFPCPTSSLACSVRVRELPSCVRSLEEFDIT